MKSHNSSIARHENLIAQQAAEIDALYDELKEAHWLQEMDEADSGSDDEEMDVSLIKTMYGKQFAVDFRVGLQCLVQDFNISGDRISPLVHRVLALMTNQTLEEIEKKVRLPSAATVYRDGVAFSELTATELSNQVCRAPSFSLCYDGGEAGNASRLSILISFPGSVDSLGQCCPQQNILGVPELRKKDRKKRRCWK